MTLPHNVALAAGLGDNSLSSFGAGAYRDPDPKRYNMKAFKNDLDPPSRERRDTACDSSFEDDAQCESEHSSDTEETSDDLASECNPAHEQNVYDSIASVGSPRPLESESKKALASEEQEAIPELVYILAGFSAVVQKLDECLNRFECTLPSMNISIGDQHFRFQPDYGVATNLGNVALGTCNLRLLLKPHGFEQVTELDAHRCDVRIAVMDVVADCRSLASLCENVDMDAVVPMTIQVLELILGGKSGLKISGLNILEHLLLQLRWIEMWENLPLTAAVATAVHWPFSLLLESYKAVASADSPPAKDAVMPKPTCVVDFL